MSDNDEKTATKPSAADGQKTRRCAACGAALRSQARCCAECGAPIEEPLSNKGGETNAKPAAKDKTTAATLALLLGGVGAHKLYLGYKTEGLIMLALTVYGAAVGYLCGFALINISVVGVALVEAVIYATATAAQFEETYIEGKRPWL